jgi:tripartite ATP-independent transporter DctP family solute receptor
MNKMKKVVAMGTCIAMLVASLSMVGCSPKAEGETEEKAEVKSIHLKYDVPVPATSSYYDGAMKFAEIINEKTAGKYVVDVFPNEQLGGGDIIKGMEMLRDGSIDFSVVNILMYTPFDQRFSVVLMPWLIGTSENADRLLAGTGGEMLFDMVDEVGMHPMAFGETGFRQITNNVRPIQEPVDLEGLKIRCPTMKMFVDYFTLMGADPSVVNFGELFTALQQNNVDGQENPLDTINSARIQNVQKYLTIWNEAYDGYIMAGSKKLWASLSEDEQVVFSEAAVEAMNYQKMVARENDIAFLEAWKSEMEVTILTPEQIEVFKEAAKPLYEEYEEIIGLELLEAFGYVK